jgi:hypothetical protein
LTLTIRTRVGMNFEGTYLNGEEKMWEPEIEEEEEA